MITNTSPRHQRPASTAKHEHFVSVPATTSTPVVEPPTPGTSVVSSPREPEAGLALNSTPATSAMSEKKGTASTEQIDVPNQTRKIESQGDSSESETEEMVIKGITALWQDHQYKGNSVRATRAELKIVRAQLGEQLSGFKKLYCSQGCDGKWSAFLKQLRMPKATADRYVKNWDRSMAPVSEKLLTEELSAPSREAIAALVKKVTTQVKRTLATPESISDFLTALTQNMQPGTNPK